MDKFIPLATPNYDGQEYLSISKSGMKEAYPPHRVDFENSFAAYIGMENAVSCQSGTAALHLSLLISDIGAGDEVIAPSITSIASANAIQYTGANPIYIDCDDYLCLDVDKVATFCSDECIFENNVLVNKVTNRQIKAVLAVHSFGNMVNMENLMKLAAQYNLIIIEDCADAFGCYINQGELKGHFAGTIGHFGVFSFNTKKIITADGGGMIVGKDNSLVERARYLSTQAKQLLPYYHHIDIGYNYQLSSIQALIGQVQLEKIEKFINIKENNFNLYKKKISAITGLSMLDFQHNIRSNYAFYLLLIEETYPLNRDQLISFLSEKKIKAQTISFFDNGELYNNDLSKARRFVERTIKIPCSTNLTNAEIEYIIKCLKVPLKQEN